MNEPRGKLTLVRKLDRIFARFADNDEEKPVKLVWVRPISGRGREVSIITQDKKEILMLKSLDELDPDSRKIAEQELAQRYLVPRITRVLKTRVTFGNRYWNVQTDRGPRAFAMKDPHKNVIRVTEDRLILRDTLGNRYEIKSLSNLDGKSQAEVQRVI